MTREEAIRLTHAFLTGQLTDQEKVKLNAWRDASAENATLFREISHAWETARTAMQFPAFEAQAAFANLPVDRPRERSRVRRIAPAWRVAVAVCVVALVTWLAYAYVFKSDTVTVTAQDHPSVVLPDETTVFLHDDASLTYPTAFRGNRRYVRMTGRGYFDVTEDDDMPFVIEAMSTDIIVVGTEFGVNADVASRTISLIVREGRVRMHPHHSGDDRFLEVGEGEGAIYNEETSVLRRVREPDMNTLAWHTGELSFVNTPVPEVIHTLESVFDIKIDLGKSNIQTCQFTSPIPFERATADEILGTLAIAFQCQVSSPEEGCYLLIGGSCAR